MTNVKPGQRAILVKAAVPANLGKVVIVLEQGVRDQSTGRIPRPPTIPGRPCQPPDQHSVMWWVETCGTPLTVPLTGDGGLEKTLTACCPDSYLRPLVDDEPEQEQTTIDRPIEQEN